MQHNSIDQWLLHARSDLELSRVKKTEFILYENLCYHAQQCVEKSLKSLLLFYDIEFPKTHNIKILLNLLSQKIEIPESIKAASILTDYAVTTRYPGDYENISREEYNETIAIADKTYIWVKQQIQ